MKPISPNLREYFHSLNLLNLNAINYAEYLNELYRKSSFIDPLGVMVFVIDNASMTYPLLGKGTEGVVGHPLAALKEGGVDFTMSHFLMPDCVNRELIQEQMSFFLSHLHIAPSQIRLKLGFPMLDRHGAPRYLFQQHLITHRTEDGLPLGCYGIASHLPGLNQETKIYQQIEIQESGHWNAVSYKEFYSKIDDDKLLSKREIEILKYIADGWNSLQVADKLCLSPHTVNTHRKNMLRRTNSKNTADLLAFAIRVGWI